MLPTTEYNRLYKRWFFSNDNPTKTVILGEYIYSLFQDGFLRKLSKVGEELNCIRADNFENEHYQLDNKLYINNSTIDCIHFYINNDIYCSTNFLDNSILIRYDYNLKELNRSKMIPKIRKMMNINDNTLAMTDNSIHVFYNLQEVYFIETPFIQDFKVLDNCFIFSTPTHITWCQLDKELKTILSINENVKCFCITNKNVIFSTNEKLFCIDKNNDILWEKEAKSFLTPFIDNGENYVMTCEKNAIEIYHIDTGIMVWKDELSETIIADPVVDNECVISTTKGIQFYGDILWQN